MKTLLLTPLIPFALGAPAMAQTMDRSMPGMIMPMPTAQPSARSIHRHAPRRSAKHPGVSSQAPAATKGSPQPAPTGGEGGMAPMSGMKGMDMASQPAGPAAAATVGNEPPPPPIADHAADALFDPAAMAAARAELRRDHGGAPWSMVMFNLAEYQAGSGGGYRWDGEASLGGDINRLFLKSEGEGANGRGVEAAEVQALYSRAISPTFNLQAGARQDLGPGGRTYATIGLEGLAPYWFEVSGAVFLSTRGELLGRLEGYDDFRLTQRWVLQPRVEVNLAAQSVRETGVGSGVSNLELGLRLRYEITREVAPYVGFSYDRKFGASADFARVRGERVAAPRLVVGIRTRF